jgi:ribosomal-protein-alanine N-acetyltransferase
LISLKDAPSIYAYAKDKAVAELTMWNPHKRLSDTKEFINEYILPNYQKDIPEPYGITLKEKPDNIIGTIGCFWNSEKNKEMEIAYALSKDFWGKEIIVEASKVLIPLIFKYFDVNRIQARCKAENLSSEKVMKKLCMTYEGTLRQKIFHNNRFWDMKYYSILKGDTSILLAEE